MILSDVGLKITSSECPKERERKDVGKILGQEKAQ